MAFAEITKRETAGDLTVEETRRYEQVAYRLILAIIDWDMRSAFEDDGGSDWHPARREIHDHAQLDCVLETMALYILHRLRGERHIEWDPDHEEPPVVFDDAVGYLTAGIAKEGTK
jgi:hypothetical protein